MSRAASLAWVLILTMLPPLPALAQPEQDSRPVLAVMGRAVLELVPDKVEMTVGVSTQAAGSAEAARQNATAMEQVLGAIRAHLGQGTLQSVGYRISPRYEWDGKRNRPAGFQAVNQVKVTLKEVARAGALLDAATQAGANVIFGPTWGLADMSAARIQVQEAALADAKAQAQALALAAGHSLDGIKSADFTAGDVPRQPLAPAPLMAARAAPETPVEPGVVSLAANVRCLWYLR